MNARGLRAVRTREDLRVKATDEAARAVSDHHVDGLDLADVAGVDPAVVSRKLSRKCGDTWTGVDVRMWLGDEETRPVGERLLSWICEGSGLRVIAERAAAGASSIFSLLHDAEDTAHRAKRAMMDALAPDSEDGTEPSTGELESIRDHAREAARTFTEVEHAAQRELDTRAAAFTTSGVRPAARN